MAYLYGDYPTKKELLDREGDAPRATRKWEEIAARWKAKAEQVSLSDREGRPFWYVLTPHLLKLVTKIAEDRGFLEGIRLSTPFKKALVDKAGDLEAYYSSHIEGAVSSLEEALSFLKKKRRRAPNESLQMILNNRVALDYASRQIGKPVTKDIICKLQHILTEKTHLDRPITRGHYRHGPVYIVDSRGQIVYEGPPHHRVPEMMSRFISWMNEEQEMEPIIKAGIVHLYFVNVHPFDDGNGRTARALSNLALANAGLRFINMLSLSDYFDHKRMRYYRAIQDVRNHGDDLTYFLIFYGEALCAKLEEVKKQIGRERKIQSIKERISSDIYVHLHRRHIKALRAMIRDDEMMTTKKYMRINVCSDETARKDFHFLMKLKLIKPKGRGRNRGYVLIV